MFLLFASTSFAEAVNSLPHFALTNAANGKAVKSEMFKGKVLLVTFFATWCPPCRQEIPSLLKLQETYESKGFTVLGISVDEGGQKVVKKMIEQDKITYPMLMADSQILRDFGGITGVPTSFLVDRQGKVIERYLGYIPYQTLESGIKSVL
jgi:thiol-disulfide isomerase/thioredoxin